MIVLASSLSSQGQVSEKLFQKNSSPVQPVNESHNLLATEICDNDIDDDGNGLADLKDYNCYYGTGNTTCAPSKVIWISSNYGIMWVDMKTKTEHRIGPIAYKVLNDITWTQDKKLIVVDDKSVLWEVNPETGSLSFIDSIPIFSNSVGMTADAEDNLYIAGRVAGSNQDELVIKYNRTTKQITTIANLTTAGIEVSGDITFFNGNLYVSGKYGKIGRINPSNGITTRLSTNGYTDYSFGLTTIGDGNLYISDGLKIYKLDPMTMRFSSTPELTISSFINIISGFATYVEQCNSISCKADLKINVQSPKPYCSNTGVKLLAEGSGLGDPAEYTWTAPDKRTYPGPSITAYISGRYYVRYSTIPDSCSKTDSIDLDITSFPVADLGADSVICPGTNFSLHPKNITATDRFLWQDGSDGPSMNISQPGNYVLSVSNVCGTNVDSIHFIQGQLPEVNLGTDQEICSFDSTTIKNFLHKQSFRYIWNDGSTNPQFVAKSPGLYWVEVSAYCGNARDSIMIFKKTVDCERGLHIPSAFTPNGDGKNDLFKPMLFGNIEKFEFSVYNRWGQLVFKSINILKGWDGQFQNTKQDAGIYTWTCTYQISGLNPSFQKGTVMLIR